MITEAIITDRIVKVGEITVDKDSFYTPEQNEEILGLGRAAIDKRVREGVLRRSGTARNILYKGQHIIDYLNNE